MGLRAAASVAIDSDAAEMAPALTEPVVSQTKLSSPATAASPRPIGILSVNSVDNSEGNKEIKYLCNKSAFEVISKGAFQLSFEQFTSNGPKPGPPAVSHMDQSKNNDNISKNESAIIFNNCLNTNPSGNSSVNNEILITNETSTNNIEETTLNQQNTSSPGISTITHNNNNMGLQKDFIKENADVEQMLGELASTSDIDLLQVFKSFESAPAGDGLCELAGGLSLFNDVDVMNMCVEDVTTTPNKECNTHEIHAEIEKRQILMERQCEFYLRRLRKIQARHIGQHVSEEIAGLFELSQRLLKRKERDVQNKFSAQSNNSHNTGDYSPQYKMIEKYKPLSTNAMKSFLKRIESVSTAQTSSLNKRGNMVRFGETQRSHNQYTNVSSIIPIIDEETTQQIDQVAGLLHAEMKTIEKAIDSDATASSSGGESADEMIVYNNTQQQPLPIAKRAAWRWARDRAAVASRWSWLLTQISDLEYRIRQHNELHYQIKKNKGAVTFEEPSTVCNETSNISTPLQPPSQQSVNGYRGALPGNLKISESLAENQLSVGGTSTTTISELSNGITDLTNTACRTRPFQRTGFRKRKLLQTVNLHTISKKAARPSTVKCGCQWPLHPCALCTGRQDPTAPRDLPDMMPLSERVALLDPCFHSVLSFPEDVSHSIHFEGVMRVPEWQNKVNRCTAKAAMKGALAAQKAAEREDRSKNFIDGSRRKYNKKYAQGLVANKLKNAKTRRTLHGKYTHLLKNKHRKLSMSTQSSYGGSGGNNTSGMDYMDHTTGGSRHQHHQDGGESGGSGGSVPRSKNSSPTPSGSSSHKYERLGYSDLRRNRNSYDIDNIVIPYSVAAATRVEILPYKEIPTPKWRVIESDDEEDDDEVIDEIETNLDVNQKNNTSQDEEPHNDKNEDISDDIIMAKHERALMDERKKFQTFMKYPWSTRSRANRRTDSRAESSGANTPDPTSPAPNTPSVSCDQESIPSPICSSTTQTPLDGIDIPDVTIHNAGTTTVKVVNNTSTFLSNNVSTSNINNTTMLTPAQSIMNNPNSILSGKRNERRRTVSLKLKDRELDSRRSNTPDIKEINPPFEALEFPLPDDVYNLMLQMMPNDHQLIEDTLKTTLSNNQNENSDFINQDRISESVDELNTNSGSGITSVFGDDTIVSKHKLKLSDDNNHNLNINNNSNVYDDRIKNILDDDEGDSDSIESGLIEEDPNDPEWSATSGKQRA